MKYRSLILHSRETFTADITKVIEVNLADPITNLVIGLEAVLGSATMANPVHANLTKIELVDGSEVVWSGTALCADAIDWYHNGGKFRSNYNYMMNGGTPYRAIGLNFGRWLWDEKYALDPKQFKNLQLRLTLDIDAVDGAAATNYLTVFANVFDEKQISPVGFIATMEVKQWTAASTTHEYTELPTEHPIRALYLQAYLKGTEPNQAVSNIKISEDRDKRVPLDLGAQEITRILLEKYGPVEEHYWFATATSAKNLYVAPSTRVVATGAVWAAAAADAQPAFYDGDGTQLKVITDTAGSNYQIDVKGYIPHAVYEIPVGDKMDDGDAYDVRGLGDLRADITGASTPVCKLLVQQYRAY